MLGSLRNVLIRCFFFDDAGWNFSLALRMNDCDLLKIVKMKGRRPKGKLDFDTENILKVYNWKSYATDGR